MARKPNPDIVKYIERHLAKGFEIKHIKQKLAEVGHPIEAIEDAAAFVLSNQPRGRKKPKAFMIVYGLILILVIGGFVWFIWFKATQQIEYAGTVGEIQKNQTYLRMSDVQLIKLAESGDMNACTFIDNHNLCYMCIEKKWAEECAYELHVGSGDECYLNKALNEKNLSACYNITDTSKKKYCLNVSFSRVLDSGNKALCEGDGRCLDLFFEKFPDAEYCTSEAINQDECVVQLAALTKDKANCDIISTNNTDAKRDCSIGAMTSFGDIIPYCEENYALFSYDIIPELQNSSDNQKATCYMRTLNYFNRIRGFDCSYLKTFINANDKIYLHLDSMLVIQDSTDPGDLTGCELR